MTPSSIFACSFTRLPVLHSSARVPFTLLPSHVFAPLVIIHVALSCRIQRKSKHITKNSSQSSRLFGQVRRDWNCFTQIQSSDTHHCSCSYWSCHCWSLISAKASPPSFRQPHSCVHGIPFLSYGDHWDYKCRLEFRSQQCTIRSECMAKDSSWSYKRPRLSFHLSATNSPTSHISPRQRSYSFEGPPLHWQSRSRPFKIPATPIFLHHCALWVPGTGSKSCYTSQIVLWVACHSGTGLLILIRQTQLSNNRYVLFTSDRVGHGRGPWSWTSWAEKLNNPSRCSFHSIPVQDYQVPTEPPVY